MICRRVWRHLERGSSEGLFLLVILLVLLVATFVVLLSPTASVSKTADQGNATGPLEAPVSEVPRLCGQ